MSIPWAGIGTFLGGAAQAGGTFWDNIKGSFDGKGAKDRREEYGKMLGTAITSQWDSTMRMAKKHGIHPLAALGQSVSNVPFQRVGGSGSTWANIGQGISRMAQAGQSEIQKAQVANIQADTELKRMEARKMAEKAPPGQMGSQGIKVTNLPLSSPHWASGEERGQAVQALEQLYRDDRGIINAMPAEGAQDYMSESAIANIPYQFKKVWRQLFTPAAAISQKKLNVIRDRLDDMEGFMRQNGKLRPDEYLTYDSNEGLPRVKRDTGEKKRLFFLRNKNYKQQPLRYGGMWYRRN